MGLFGAKEKLLKSQGNKHREAVEEFLLDGEVVESLYPLVIDFLCVTNKRIIFVDKEVSIKDPTTAVITIPYKNITEIGLVKNDKAFATSDEIVIISKGGKYKLKFVKSDVTNANLIYKELVSKIL
ncbi:MAG: PH domain-containing protein [Clostridium chrysemydis]|uniref:PH domain-containing protein n=1 Tax=Clostridium TaxID=1485 RepID=UPI00215274DE|nr:PH domain-containing protein [Clostridium sp. LY3-2]MCR6513864.1 PH domain-containing protein [Clostridium sp. LY3-2]